MLVNRCGIFIIEHFQTRCYRKRSFGVVSHVGHHRSMLSLIIFYYSTPYCVLFLK